MELRDVKMSRLFSLEEVAEHNNKQSCWVILYGHVYDVTDFLSSHPGGSRIILSLAGQDATEDYDPVHPPGMLEENLKPEAKLGQVKPSAPGAGEEPERAPAEDDSPRMETLLNLDDIEEAAIKRISTKAAAYYVSAGDDMISKKLNNTVYRDILLRPRVFVDCTSCDISTSMLGHNVGLPIFVAPAAMARLGHPDGEHGIAKAAASFGAAQIISNYASMTPEQIVQGAPEDQVFGWQLYVQSRLDQSVAMLDRINAMRDRIKFICLTLDAPVPGKREVDERENLHRALAVQAVGKGEGEKRPGGGGVGQQLFFGTATDLTWGATLPWLARRTDLPIVLKGVQTHEDARIAAGHEQVKAIILSNHGGRSLDTAPPAVHTLLEIRRHCPEVFRKVEVWIDGGFRRGTDVVKALCLGARAVGLGRAALFGLGAGGQEGVERVFQILEAEMATCMRLLGARNVSELGPHMINSRRVERDIYDGDSAYAHERSWPRWKL